MSSGTRTTWAAVALAVWAATAASALADGHPGDLDGQFGNSGRVMTRVVGGPSEIYGLVVDGSERLVAVGRAGGGSKRDLAVARYLPDGKLDQSFGDQGIVRRGFSGRQDWAADVTLLADGRILTVGPAFTSEGGSTLVLRQFLEDGTPDETFGRHGQAAAAFNALQTLPTAVVVQPDDKIVVAGSILTAGEGSRFMVARFLADGRRDRTFGRNGVVRIEEGDAGIGDEAEAVALCPDGGIVAAGTIDGALALVRILPTGALDSGFGSGGIARSDIGSGNDYAWDLKRQSDGKLVVAGSSWQPTTPRALLARFLANGQPDDGFGSHGVALWGSGQGAGADGFTVALEGDGSILLGGADYGIQPARFVLLRYTSTGVLDPGFGAGGIVITPFPAGSAVATSAAMTEVAAGSPSAASGDTSRVVLAGYAHNARNKTRFALVRYLP